MSVAQVQPHLSITVLGVEVRPPCTPPWVTVIQASIPPTAAVDLKASLVGATALQLTLAHPIEETITDRYGWLKIIHHRFVANA